MERRKIQQKIGVLSLSTVTGAATGITSIIPMIATAYPTKQLATIESLVTISSLSALFTILLNDRLTKKFGVRPVILSGLILGTFAGIAPFFISNYLFFLVTRFILGLGIGLYSPHALALISLLYSGEERTALLGVQMGISALGNAILLLFSGWFASIHWTFTFFIYLLLGVIAFFIWRFVPDVVVPKEERTDKHQAVNKKVKMYLFLCFVTFLIIWGVQLKIPTYLVSRGFSSAKTAGTLLGLMNLSGMFAGLMFGSLYKRYKEFMLPIGFLGAAISVLGILISTSWQMIFVWSLCFNFVYSFTGPAITLQVNQSALKNQLTKVNSLIVTTTILSAYFAPYVWNFLTKMFYTAATVQQSLIILLCSLAAIGLFLFIYCVRNLHLSKVAKANNSVCDE